VRFERQGHEQRRLATSRSHPLGSSLSHLGVHANVARAGALDRHRDLGRRPCAGAGELSRERRAVPWKPATSHTCCWKRSVLVKPRLAGCVRASRARPRSTSSCRCCSRCSARVHFRQRSASSGWRRRSTARSSAMHAERLLDAGDALARAEFHETANRSGSAAPMSRRRSHAPLAQQVRQPRVQLVDVAHAVLHRRRAELHRVGAEREEVRRGLVVHRAAVARPRHARLPRRQVRC